MKSLVCNLDSESATETALKEAEAFANLCGLSEKNSLHLRLLAEELLGMATGVLELHDGSFSIEAEKMKFRLCLTARAAVGEQAKSRLLEASSTGENALHKGISGKIRQALDFLLVSPPSGVVIPIGMHGGMYGGILPSSASMEWSLECYRQSVALEKKAQSWDELEKSILGKLADDVRIGVQSDRVEITIDKTFSENK